MTDLRRSSSNDAVLMLRVLRHVYLTTGFGRRTARAADRRQWSEMKSASDTVTLVTGLTLLAAKMSSRLIGGTRKPASRLSHELRQADRIKTLAQLHVNKRIIWSRAVGVTAY